MHILTKIIFDSLSLILSTRRTILLRHMILSPMLLRQIIIMQYSDCMSVHTTTPYMLMHRFEFDGIYIFSTSQRLQITLFLQPLLLLYFFWEKQSYILRSTV